MAIKQESIGETFTNEQRELITLYEKQIDDKLVKDYIEGKKLDVIPTPYPHSNRKEKYPHGTDERVVGEILRKYTEAGWKIEWAFNKTSEINGDWVFRLKKIDNPSDFMGKSLKISFIYQDSNSWDKEHKLIIPILGVCKTKIVSDIEKYQIEYMNFCIPTNFYITDKDIIKFVRYYNKENHWVICLQNEICVSKNLKVEII